MCASLSIDPLAGPLPSSSSSTSSSLWASLLGLPDWTYELSLQIIDVSISTRPLNGGVLPLTDLVRRLNALRGIADEGGVTEDDVRRAISTLGPLDSGLAIVSLGGVSVLRASPSLLNSDVSALVAFSADGGRGGRLTCESVVRGLGWKEGRARSTLEDGLVLGEGVAWVDAQAGGTGREREYWVSGVVAWEA